MGEYVKYRGNEVKIGTMESMYYVSFKKYTAALEAGLLSTALASASPEDYVRPESGSRFRFPFPDEDKLPFGRIIEPFDRGLQIKLNPQEVPFLDEVTLAPGALYELTIIQQKLVNRHSDGKSCLALLYHDPVLGETFRIEDDDNIKALVEQVRKHHIFGEKDLAKKEFYTEVCARALDGYGLPNPAFKVKQDEKSIKNKGNRTKAKKFKRGL